MNICSIVSSFVAAIGQKVPFRIYILTELGIKIVKGNVQLFMIMFGRFLFPREYV